MLTRRNLRPFAVEVVDPDTGDVYECAARPGVVELPDKLAKSLDKQPDAWGDPDADEKPKRGRAADEGDKP